ncbi:MAG: GspH/FimT family protein, partial [Betaproteobacteria bacterium]|nr:GspH/FimT family protein [Betaproteobacteria bacterium]
VEAERLAQLLDLAGTEARMSGKSVAWTADGAGYRFWRYREGAGWSEIGDNPLFRRRELPQSMTITGVLVEAMNLYDPVRLEFTAHGIMPAYDIGMVFGTERYTVSGSPAGEVEALPGEKMYAGIPPR